MYKVSSEIYKETNFQPVQGSDGKVISKFKFKYPQSGRGSRDELNRPKVDKDGDLLVERRYSKDTQVDVIEIEHSESTILQLVGLQVWRGSLLLADYFFHCRHEFKDKQILELGAGVGLTSIAAAIYAKKVICTDVDIGGILTLIRANVARNQKLFQINKVHVMEYNFMQPENEYSSNLLTVIDDSDVVVAADVIYEDDLTDAFIRVIDFILRSGRKNGKQKTIYVALEKRYVFTLSELDTVAPMFEYFLKQTVSKSWLIKNIPIDFPQYFEYERCKHLVLLQITGGGSANSNG